MQPASLDLRLGDIAYRVRSSFLPGPEQTVAERIDALKLHELDLSDGAVLERGCVYLVPLQESLALPADGLRSAQIPRVRPDGSTSSPASSATAPAASTRCPPAIRGPLYLEIRPRTFPVRVRTGSRLSQMRFRVGDTRLSLAEHQALHRDETLVFDANEEIGEGVALSIDLKGEGRNGLIGFRSKRHTAVIDMDIKDTLDVLDYLGAADQPRHATSSSSIPTSSTSSCQRESVHVPPAYAAEMVPFDPLVGEFRVHYAGFFDPGFGHSAAGGTGSRAVLEVRSREVPFLLGHGQTIGRLVYERLAETPDRLYGVRPRLELSGADAEALQALQALSVRRR